MSLSEAPQVAWLKLYQGIVRPLLAPWLKLYQGMVRPLLEPWLSIPGSHFQFMTWIVAIIVLGLAAAWLPLLLIASRADNPSGAVLAAFRVQLYGGTLASFSVAILAEGLLGLMLPEEMRINKTASGIRGLVVCLTVLLILFSAGVMAFESTVSAVDGRGHISTSVHVALGVASLTLAAYLYCFRLPGWEDRIPTAAEEKEREDAEVTELALQAAQQTSDGGVSL